MKKSQKLLALSILLALISWSVPALALATLPLQYLYTHLHEFGHAFAAVATGGSNVAILVFANGSGETTAIGGIPLFISPAGYIGATVIGAVLLYLSRNPQGARRALLFAAGLLAVGGLLWIRGDVVGVTTAIVWALLLWACGAKLRGDTLQFAGQFMGAYLSLASLQAVFDTFGFRGPAAGENDAQILEGITGIPAALSSLLWAGVSVATVFAMIRLAWKDESRQAR